jgi:peptide/nickel transport system substrate-binding protein
VVEPPPGPVTLRIGLGTPAIPSPGTGIANPVGAISAEPWVTVLPDGKPNEKVATGWSWDESRTTLRLTLRNDVYFHDGTLLTPDIAVLAFRKSMAAVGAPTSFSSVQSVAASGNGVDVKLSEPNSFFLPDLAQTAVRLPDKPQIATGPFKITQSDPQRVSLQAFDRYYRGQPSIAAVEITNYPTQRNAWAALMRGEADMLYEVGRDAEEFVQAVSTVKTYSFPRPYYNVLVFNQRHPVLKRIEVRRALNEAVDRTALIRDAMNGRGRPADGPLLPEHWASSAASRSFVFNPTAVRSRFEEAGLRVRPSSDGRMPSRFSFTCLLYGDDPRFERLAVLIQKQLADVGVEMRLVPLPLQELGQRVAKGDFDAFLMEMAGRSLGWVYDFWHSPRDKTLFDSGYRSADAVLDRIKGAATDDEVRQGIAELLRILHEDPPAAFLAWQMTSRAVSTKFDVAFEADRDIFGNVWKWRPAAARQAAR